MALFNLEAIGDQSVRDLIAGGEHLLDKADGMLQARIAQVGIMLDQVLQRLNLTLAVPEIRIGPLTLKLTGAPAEKK